MLCKGLAEGPCREDERAGVVADSASICSDRQPALRLAYQRALRTQDVGERKRLLSQADR